MNPADTLTLTPRITSRLIDTATGLHDERRNILHEGTDTDTAALGRAKAGAHLAGAYLTDLHAGRVTVWTVRGLVDHAIDDLTVQLVVRGHTRGHTTEAIAEDLVALADLRARAHALTGRAGDDATIDVPADLVPLLEDEARALLASRMDEFGNIDEADDEQFATGLRGVDDARHQLHALQDGHISTAQFLHTAPGAAGWLNDKIRATTDPVQRAHCARQLADLEAMRCTYSPSFDDVA